MRYIAYGLSIESELELPDLLPGGDGPTDVCIRYREVSPDWVGVDHENWVYRADGGSFTLEVGGVARYQVVDGRDLWIEPASGSDESAIRLYLLGSALGALLHQRNILAIHASAIEVPRGAVLFTGEAGIGKSTLLAAFVKRGIAMLADDVTGITLDDGGRPLVLPAFPRIRLSAASVAALKQPAGDLLRSSRGQEKYDLPVTRFPSQPVPLKVIYELAAQAEPGIRIELVEGIGKFELLARQTYRWEFMHDSSQRRPHFDLAKAAASAATVKRVSRPRGRFLLDELVDEIEADLAASDQI